MLRSKNSTAFIRKTTYLRNAAFLISLPDIFFLVANSLLNCTPVSSALKPQGAFRHLADEVYQSGHRIIE